MGGNVIGGEFSILQHGAAGQGRLAGAARVATVAVMQDAGHRLHHDQPAALARLAAEFLAE